MRIALLTSGGDSPGMNAALHSLARAGLGRGHEVLGVQRGYEGLLDGDLEPFSLTSTDGISRFGGTILGSARSKVFPTEEGQARAREQLKRHDIGALVVIGGNGSLAGAHRLAADRPCAVVGIPASIDNDIGCTVSAIGVDTAVNTIVEACDRISDTARAHRRAFIVEVMGRHCGYLAMRSGIAAEADAILFAEKHMDEDALVAHLREVLKESFSPARGKKRVLVVKAEGVRVPTARLIARLQEHLDEDAPGVEIRETILGHVVRGGRPSATDRVLAQRLALGALMAVESGRHDVMTAWEPPGSPGTPTADPSVRLVPLQEVLEETDRLLDGTSAVVKARVALLEAVEGLLAL